MEDYPGLVDFNTDGRAIFLRSSVGSDTARLVSRELATWTGTVVTHRGRRPGRKADHPVRHVVEAASFSPDRKRWQVIDPSVTGDFDALAKVDDRSRLLEDRPHTAQLCIPGVGSLWIRRNRGRPVGLELPCAGE
jgi:hypothetical protein